MKEKRCSKCYEVKSLTEFYSQKESKDGFRSICKKCFIRLAQKWVKDNPEQAKASQREWFNKNKAKYKYYKRDWLVAHPGYMHEYYRKNLDKGLLPTKEAK